MAKPTIPDLLGVTRRRKRGRRPNNEPDKRFAAPGPLTPTGRTAGSGHQEATKELERAERRARAVRLFVDQQLTYEQIGRELGVSNYTVAKDLERAFEDMQAYTVGKLDALRAVEVRRTMRNDRAVLALLYGTSERQGEAKLSPRSRAEVQLKAHERLTASVERRAKLQGLEVQKVAMTDPSGSRRYHDLSDDELARLVREREARLLPVVEGTVVRTEVPDGNEQQ